MILARLKWNTPLYKVDEFVTKFRDRYKNKQVKIDVKLTDTECLIYLFKKFNWWKKFYLLVMIAVKVKKF